MSSPRYPLYNIRKNAYGVWQQVHELGESVTVPGSASAYCTRLLEVPDNGSVHSKPAITGLTRAELYPPSAGEFWVNYSTGDLVFSSELEGNTYNVDYWKRGSLIDSSDINLLYNRIIEKSSAPTVYDDGYEIGTLWINIVTNEYYICTNNTSDSAIWIPRGSGSGGTSGTSGTSGITTGSEFIHIQASASDVWTIIHNTGIQYPQVEIYDSTNNIVIPYSIVAQDNDTLVVSFSKAISGRASLIFGAGTSGTSGTTGPAGASGTSGTSGITTGSEFIHIQASASNIWTILHNTGIRYPQVEIYDETSNIVIPYSIVAQDDDTLIVSFSDSISGRASLIFGAGTSGTSGSSGTSGIGISGTSGSSGSSGLGYKHEQSTPSTLWDITHNLNWKYLTVNVYDTTDVVIIPYEIRAINENRLTITFPESLSGIAVLSY